MIIDIHTHYGVIDGGYQMPLEMQLEAMQEYGIDYALISNIECGIWHEGIAGNQKMLDMVRRNSDRLGCVLWCCENLTETEKDEFEKMYLANQDIVKGLKIHPDIAQERADSPCFDFYYAMGAEYGLPVILHTKDSLFSKVEYVVNVATHFPNTKLILGHMQISSDGKKALEAIKAYDNLYGDTAWVKLEVVKLAYDMGISHKIMFGTDSPISGRDCYMDDYYKNYYEDMSEYITDIMSENAKKMFNIKMNETFYKR